MEPLKCPKCGSTEFTETTTSYNTLKLYRNPDGSIKYDIVASGIYEDSTSAPFCVDCGWEVYNPAFEDYDPKKDEPTAEGYIDSHGGFVMPEIIGNKTCPKCNLTTPLRSDFKDMPYICGECHTEMI